MDCSYAGSGNGTFLYIFIGGGNMEYLKIILYILVFPGLIFSSFMGFFISGLDRKIVAKMQRRRGPKISQSFYDFIKLFKICNFIFKIINFLS